MEKETDRRRENLSIINKITLLISKEDSQTPGRDLVFILKADRPTADQNLYLQNIYFIYPLYISLHYIFIFLWGDPGRYFTLHLYSGANSNRLREKIIIQIYYRFYLYIRRDDLNLIYLIDHLFQQFVVDACAIIKLERLQ